MNSKVLGSALLIAGTCVGAVMLILPLQLLELGSFGVFTVLCLTQVLMYYSGLFIFQVALTFPKGTDLAGMAASLFAPWVGRLVNLLFLLLLFCLLALYLTSGSALIAESGPWHAYGILLWAILGIGFLIFGMRAQDWLNRIFMLLLVLSYCLFVGSSAMHVRLDYMVGVPFQNFWPSVAVVATAFGYHVIIPSLRDYLGDDVKYYKQTLRLGLAIPLVLYLVWCFSLYGLMPYSGEIGLLKLSQTSNSYLHIRDYLFAAIANPIISTSVFVFMLTSILSSYIGIAISLFQAISSSYTGPKLLRALIVILPPAIFAIVQPGGFLLALKYAALIVALISLILPVALVLRAAERQSLGRCRLILLAVIAIYGLSVIYSGLL